MSKQTKITKSARDQMCQVRVPFVCNGNTETTVFAHLGGGGMGIKRKSNEGAYCCSDCHDAIDGRVKTQWSKDELRLWHFEGVMRTQGLMINAGLIEVKE